MVSLIHEVGWRSALFFLFTAGVSFYSLVALVRQTARERQNRIATELGQALRADQDDMDPVNVLLATPSGRGSALARTFLISAYAVMFLGSLWFGLPAMKSALYAHRANAAFAEHNYEDAIKLYDSALIASPYANFLHAQYQTAFAQNDGKGGELGEKRRMVTLHPGDEGFHNDLGNALMQRGEMANAIKEYKLAVALKPDDPIVHNNLGNALQTARRFPEAIAELRKALELDPNQVPTYYNLANTLMANDQVDEAIKFYHSAIDRNPKLAPAYYNLAQGLAKQGKRNEAMTAMDTFLQLAPKQPEFAAVIVKAKQQIADWRKTP